MASNERDDDALMAVPAVADHLGIPQQTLYIWRTQGKGPRAIKVGRHLRYRRSEIERWLDAHTESAPGVA